MEFYARISNGDVAPEAGVPIQAEGPPRNGEWDPFFRFPVHPFELCSRLEQPLYERIFADVAATITDAVV